MALDLFGAAGSLVGGIGSFVAGNANADAFAAEAKGFDTASNYALFNAQLAGEIGGLQELAAARKIQSTQGTQQAVAAANGLKIGGSDLALIRDATQQGYLQEGLIGLNTAIQTTNYDAQAASYQGQKQAAQAAAQAAKANADSGLFGGILGAAGKLFGGLF